VGGRGLVGFEGGDAKNMARVFKGGAADGNDSICNNANISARIPKKIAFVRFS